MGAAAKAITGGRAERVDRGVVAIAGADAAVFLHGILTNTVKTIVPGEGRFGALLTPQGKVLFDFFVTRDGDGFLFEVSRAILADFIKRLGFYRLRAAVTIADRSADFAVMVDWGEALPFPEAVTAFPDPRLAALGRHLLVPRTLAGDLAPSAPLVDWHALRIGLGVPESGADFALGEVFPHDVDMDDLDGVDFKKGCFIGQEVVSRMKHRGTARKRFVVAATLEAGAALPPAGAEILAADRVLGALGSSIPGLGLAEVRLDRAKEAFDAGVPILAGDVAVTLTLPGFARFGWPEPAA